VTNWELFVALEGDQELIRRKLALYGKV